jgi:hypothetical protein
VCACLCVCACVRMCVCMCVYLCVRARARARTRACARASVRAHAHGRLPVCVCVWGGGVSQIVLPVSFSCAAVSLQTWGSADVWCGPGTNFLTQDECTTCLEKLSPL